MYRESNCSMSYLLLKSNEFSILEGSVLRIQTSAHLNWACASQQSQQTKCFQYVTGDKILGLSRVCVVCVWVYVWLFSSSINTMIRSSPACSRKKQTKCSHVAVDLLSTTFSLLAPISSGTLSSNRFISSENSSLARFVFPPTTTVLPSCNAQI